MSEHLPTIEGTVALFNASDDTVDMVSSLLVQADKGQRLIWCHFSDLKKGVIDFDKYLAKHNPEVVVFDLSPPYDENWRFFETMRDSPGMTRRGVVLTTTNKNRLDEVLGENSHALEVVGKVEDLKLIGDAIQAAAQVASRFRTH
jgi:hypothetical protein